MGLECAGSPGLQGSGWGVGQDIKSSVVFKLVNVVAVFIHNPPILSNSRFWISVWLLLLKLTSSRRALLIQLSYYRLLNDQTLCPRLFK